MYSLTGDRRKLTDGQQIDTRHVMFLRKYKEKQFLVDTAQWVFVSRVVRESQFDELGGLRQIAVFMSDIFRRYIINNYVHQYPY
jgi:hypothetical protein